MTVETTQLQPMDVKIKKTKEGTVIHIFTQTDAENTIRDIVKGLHLLKTANQLPRELDDTLKSKEQPHYLIMAFAEVKRISKNSLEQAEKHASNFLDQLPKIS
jgi:hypothetical protein